MKKPIPNSVCDDCLNTECVWRAPSWGIDPPVMDCPDKKAPSITNADYIRSMSDEELAKVLHNTGGNWYSEEYWLKWLKQDYITFVAQEYEKDLNDRLNREGISP